VFIINRISQLTAALSESNFACALIHRTENMRYLTGFTGDGSLFVKGGSAAILTSFLYAEQAERETDVRVIRIGGDVKKGEALRLLAGETQTLAIEADYVTVEQLRELEEALPGVSFPPLGATLTTLRAVKYGDEIEYIRRACAIACLAFEGLLGWIKPGMTERQIQIKLDYAMLKLGSEGIAFPTIVCAGPNGSLPHATPGDRPIQRGDLVTMDFGAQVSGYKSDMTRTIGVGEVSAELRAMYDTALRASNAATGAIRAGARCSEIDAIAREIIEPIYPGAFGHSLGHGVGLVVHESPGLSSRESQALQAGNVVTVEPGIYLKGIGGCRIEDMGAVTECGFDNMIGAEKRLILI